MRIHLIAIGGSIMHNLAIALHREGHHVTGSDDVIYGIAKTKLEKEGLFPATLGWDADSIDSTIELVILGMHAKADNPELKRAQELGLDIQSFPEYVANRAANAVRIVVAGSHGKTTTTSMIMHLLKQYDVDFDYLVGAQLDGFDLMVKLSGASIIVIEGDEYLSSAIDRRPKFVHYHPDYTIITGIAWDHANVFPTEAIYQEQFELLLATIGEESQVFYDITDSALASLMEGFSELNATGYLPLRGNGKVVISQDVEFPMQVFGQHNRKNMHAAVLLCEALGYDKAESLRLMQSFKGAALRQQVVREANPLIYRDFGHAPSKVRATIEAVVENHPDASIGVVVELHTYSSMQPDFIPHYAGVFEGIEHCVVCFDAEAFQIKGMQLLEPELIKTAFASSQCRVITKAEDLKSILGKWQHLDVVLVLSSGNMLGIQYY